MLYDIYQAVKTQITATDIDGKIKGVEWNNVQYKGGSISNTPRIFVEFPEPLPFTQVTKMDKRTPLTMRLHVVTQAISQNDGSIDDSVALEHETIALQVKDAIDKFTPEKEGAKLTTPMQLSAWQHFHKYEGWMITYIDFSSRKYI